eukprot:gb/GEZJ01002293.1/.p1 GENE.gb/GEZJ01002293.1/~~gb/GEZJ01002293.1/.p1  ORF type:complete len:206 (+),score=22.41 gb/GEZJ01002293.1/:412-1029(+)
MVIALNLGVWYDDFLKLTYQHCMTKSDKSTLTIPVAMKCSTKERFHEFQEWNGSRELRYLIYVDPYIALLKWLCLRGSVNGSPFCDVKETAGGIFLLYNAIFSVSKFTDVLRIRMHAVGVGECDVKAHSGHSLKRGAVQLYRAQGFKNEMIMELVQPSDYHSYSNYCEAYNDCQSNRPRFSSVDALLNHAYLLGNEMNSDKHEQK